MAKATKPKSAYDLPPPDQLEISLFGPGYGECILIHYGEGKWFTVDSCLEPDNETPSALSYLNALGLDPANCVSHNVLTHPDGDHIGGISALYAACSSARLVCPTVLAEKTMVSYAAHYAQTESTILTQTARELRHLLDLCLNRPPHKCPMFVKQDTAIIDEFGVRVAALAPSDIKIQRFLARVSTEIPIEKTDRRAPRRLTPNEVSVALLIEREGFSAILGADLEETPGAGWTEILSSSIAFQKAKEIRGYKIAHHGSSNADCPALWAAMNDPVVLLAPFKHGRHKIPTRADVDRIGGHTKNAFSVSSFKTQKVKRLSRVDKILIDHGMKRRDLFPKNGHIRLRIDAAGELTVDLYNSAIHLSRVH